MGVTGTPAKNERPLRVLFVHNALYSACLLKEGFRALGHRADNLYFDFHRHSKDLTWGCDFDLPGRWWATPLHLGFLAYALARYDVFHFLGKPYLVPACYAFLRVPAPWDLALLKRAGKTVVYQSDGCYNMIRPSAWKTRIDPAICHVCQTTQGDTYGFCSNKNTVDLNTAMRKHADIRCGIGLDVDFEEGLDFEYYPVDTERWRPGIEIPAAHRVPRRTEKTVLVYHGVGSHAVGQRGDIKGTSHVVHAIDALRAEGVDIQLMLMEKVPHDAIRFYQAQADIVVDQLLVPGGGQTGREGLALGKPVLTRLHPAQRKAFAAAARPEDPPPYVHVDARNLKKRLRLLAARADLRRRLGERGAEFAQRVLSPFACAARYAAAYRRVREAGR